MHDPAGAWELPQELVMLRETIRRFMHEEVKPVEDTLEHDAYTPAPAQLADLQRKARDLGLWLFETPAENGGAGLNLLGQRPNLPSLVNSTCFLAPVYLLATTRVVSSYEKILILGAS